MSRNSDAEATRAFPIFSVLVGHTGQVLTPDLVDTIKTEMLDEIESGPCAWAFRPVRCGECEYQQSCFMTGSGVYGDDDFCSKGKRSGTSNGDG